MKTFFFGLSLVILLGLSPSFAAAPSNPTTVPIQAKPGVYLAPTSTAYAIVARDANSQVWQRTVYERTPDGKLTSRLHNYTELAGGLNYKNTLGQWVPSAEKITILPDGTAAATQGQHKAYFPSDIYNGVIRVVSSDSVSQISRPMGLSYDDGSNTVMIAMLTNSIGHLVGSNQVVYPDAFVGIHADLRYTYKKEGFEQDVLLRAQPPSPNAFGLLSQNTQMQVMTEFFNDPQPELKISTRGIHGRLADTDLSFGKLKMVRGKAFAIGMKSGKSKEARNVAVYKSWQKIQGRHFLVEEVPVPDLAAELEQLPAPVDIVVKSLTSPLHKLSAKHLLTPSRPAQNNTNKMLLAKADFNSKPAVVLDYDEINSDQTDFTFNCGATYLISGNLYLYGTTTFQGSAVIKYNRGSGLVIMGNMDMNLSEEPLAPIIFTACNDDSVGEIISGSSGMPSGAYANYAIFVGPGSSSNFHNFRVAYASTGIVLDGGGDVPISNAGFAYCSYALDLENQGSAYLSNAQFSNIGQVFNMNGSSGNSVNAQYVTFNNVDRFGYDGNFGNSSFLMTNCIFANISSLGVSATLIFADYNGFYNNGFPAFGSNPRISTSNPFQSGTGGYFNNDDYLTSASSFVNAGSVSAPWAGLYYWTTQADQALEGTSQVDLGYHHLAVDSNGNPWDTDGNGVPDYMENADGDIFPDNWEWQYFGHLGIDPNADPDGDGYTNYQEYKNGTDPTVIDQPYNILVTLPGTGAIIP